MRLERAGHRVHRLFASGRRAPSCQREEYVHRLDNHGLVVELEHLSGTDPGILGDRELLDMVLPVVRGDLLAIERYRAGPDSVVASPITVLVGDDDPKTTVDEARAWSKHTVGGCETVVFPGGHFYLVPHRREVVKLVADRL